LRDVRRKMVFEIAQTSKRASFFSSFWACFRKTCNFSEWLRCVVFEGKASTLTVSVVSLWNVTVRPC